MQAYLNLGGDSGVAAFEVGAGQITVQFRDGSTYLYTDGSAGRACIAEMQRLALQHHGLNSFISRVVRRNYARRWRA